MRKPTRIFARTAVSFAVSAAALLLFQSAAAVEVVDSSLIGEELLHESPTYTAHTDIWMLTGANQTARDNKLTISKGQVNFSGDDLFITYLNLGYFTDSPDTAPEGLATSLTAVGNNLTLTDTTANATETASGTGAVMFTNAYGQYSQSANFVNNSMLVQGLKTEAEATVHLNNVYASDVVAVSVADSSTVLENLESEGSFEISGVRIQTGDSATITNNTVKLSDITLANSDADMYSYGVITVGVKQLTGNGNQLHVDDITFAGDSFYVYGGLIENAETVDLTGTTVEVRNVAITNDASLEVSQSSEL